MFRIAIVDDDINVCTQITEYLGGSLGNTGYSVDEFANGLEFVEAFNNLSTYDIVFLDIEMPHLDGFLTGQKIRELDQDENIYIVYVSSHTDALTKFFAIHPFDFLTKPVDFDSFQKILNNIIKDINAHTRRIEFTYNRTQLLLPINKITYIEALNRKVLVHTQDGPVYDIYEKLSSLYERINGDHPCFIRPHKSFIVNRQHIDRYDKHFIVIDNISIPIGAMYRQQFFNELYCDTIMRSN